MVVDTVDSRYIQVQLTSPEISKLDHSGPSCELATSNATFPAASQEVRRGFVLLGLTAPPVGRYVVSCTLNTSDSTVTFETGLQSLLSVVDSYQVEVEAVALTEEAAGRRVVLTVANTPELTNPPTCFYRRASTLEGGLLRDSTVLAHKQDLLGRTETKVDCGTFDPMGGGIFQFGLVLAASSTAVSNLKLATKEATLSTPAPVPTSAAFSTDLTAVTITFDTNIQSVQKTCGGLFQTSTIRRLGESPSCKLRADQVIITLGNGASLKFGQRLDLSPDNGITELHSEEEYSEQAQGSLNVEVPADLSAYRPAFALAAPAEICAAGSFPLTVSDLQGFGPGQVAMAWTAEASSGGSLDLSEHLKESFRGPQRFLLPARLLEVGEKYTLTAVATNSLGINSTAVSVTFGLPSSLGLSVTLAGPSSIHSDQVLEVQAKVSQCNSSSAIPAYRYFWSTDGPLSGLGRRNLHSLRLAAGSLQGGTTYNFSVIVQSEETAVSGGSWLQVQVEEVGPLAKLAANKLMFGTQSEVVLDATLSQDRDHSAGNLQFEWHCQTNSSGCFVYREETATRLEEFLEADTLRQQYVVLEAGVLVPAIYQFTVTVSKGNLSSSAVLEVEVVPGNPPTISPITLQSRYNPAEAITINSIISGAAGTCVHWQSALEDGYVYLDLDQVTRSAEVQCFIRDIPSREFPLVLPAPGAGFPGLQGGATYKFLVTASHATLGVTEAAVVVETFAPPSLGSILVSPTSGEAMRTVFTVTATDFHDEDTPLVYSFSYRHLGSPNLHPLKRVTSSLPVIRVRLPGSPEGLAAGPVQVVVRVCDALEACTEAVSETLEVAMVKLEVGDIRTLGQEVAMMATNKECVEALSLVSRTLQTARGDRDTAARYRGRSFSSFSSSSSSTFFSFLLPLLLPLPPGTRVRCAPCTRTSWRSAAPPRRPGWTARSWTRPPGWSTSWSPPSAASPPRPSRRC